MSPSILIVLLLLLFGTWYFALKNLIPSREPSRYAEKAERLSKIFGYDKVKADAQSSGINITIKEYLIMVCGSMLIGLVLAAVLKNIFFIGAGIIISFTLPKFIVSKARRNRRRKILFELTDNLKLLVSKLVDFPSVLSALEQSVTEMRGETKGMFEQMYYNLQTGDTLEAALIDIQNQLKVRRFDDFAEKLLMAAEQGFHDQAIRSLKQTVRVFTSENVLLKKIEIQSKRHLTQLRIITVMVWAIPLILSNVNTDNMNIFLSTTYGQIYLVILSLVTVWVHIKADEYASLRLDQI